MKRVLRPHFSDYLLGCAYVQDAAVYSIGFSIQTNASRSVWRAL